MLTRYLILIWVLTIQNLVGQNYVDIARLYYNNTSPNNFDKSLSETRVAEAGLDINYPVVLKNGNAFLMGLLAEQTRVRLFENESYADLSSITFRFGLNKKHSDKWSGTYLFIPKAASDFKTSSSENFQFGALVLMRINKSETMNYKIGLFYNSELFGPFITPILGLYYLSPNSKFEMNMALPSSFDLGYSLAKSLAVGVNFSGQIKSYRLADVAGTGGSGYVRKSSNEICSYLKINFGKNLSLQTRIGYTVGRAYRVYAAGDKMNLGISFIKIGDDRTQLNSTFSDGMIYQAILLYRFVRE